MKCTVHSGELKDIPDEKRILGLVAAGSEAAFRTLFDQYRDRVFYIGRLLLKDEIKAEDVVQEVFIKVWTNREKLTGIINFKAWLNTITRNEVYSLFRKMAGEESFLREMTAQKKEAMSGEALNTIAFKELQRELARAITQLTPQQKKIFELSRLDGLSHEEIAIVLQLTRQTVKKHLTDALRTIRTRLRKNAAVSSFAILCLFLP
jgi:RNA polymerase sigma-70 factor (ECF subfamily)